MKVLYFDCISGASGDMILGALADAGASETAIRRELDRLGLDGWSLRFETVTRGALQATNVIVTATEGPPRSPQDIDELLANASLTPEVERVARAAFRRLAEAEARVHGMSIEEVHFHEIGALDAIVDIVGCCAALQDLGPESVVTSPIPLGRGSIESDHGTLPLPAPAVTELLKQAIVIDGGENETVTPTGAALLATFTDDFGPLPEMRLEATGYGAGDRDEAKPNVLRVLVGTTVEEGVPGEHTVVIETNIDDMNPELIPYVIDALLVAGAQDAWMTPILMKKGRPAYTLSALTSETERDRVVDVLYRETTTLGLRSYPVTKNELLREWVEVEVEGHSLRVKLGRLAGEAVTASPEHDDAVRVARATGMALKDVYIEAARAARERVQRLT